MQKQKQNHKQNKIQKKRKEKQKYLMCLHKLVKIEMSLTKLMSRQSKHETKFEVDNGV